MMVFSTVKSEPTPAVRALMQESVSLFSFGIYRLTERLNQPDIIGPDLIGSTDVDYRWKTNRIKIFFREFSTPGYCGLKDSQACRDKCQSVFTALKQALCYQENCSENSFGAYFSHIGYSRDLVGKKTDGEVAAGLKDITEIEVQLRLSTHGSKMLVCEGPITRDKASFRIYAR